MTPRIHEAALVNDAIFVISMGTATPHESELLREHIAGLEAEIKRLSEWKDAVEDEAANTHTFTDADTPREMLQRIIKWWMAVALDPAVSEDAQKLRDTYKTEWRSMETAPRDGTVIACWVNTGSPRYVRALYFSAGYFCDTNSGASWLAKNIHGWLPLPEANIPPPNTT